MNFIPVLQLEYCFWLEFGDNNPPSLKRKVLVVHMTSLCGGLGVTQLHNSQNPISHNIISFGLLSQNRYPFRFLSPIISCTLRRNQIKMTSMSNSLTGFSSALSAVTGMIYRFPSCTNRTEPT
ncbi:hypothetical protein Hanom_Chr12g01172441 [Helianthus anomalus]